MTDTNQEVRELAAFIQGKLADLTVDEDGDILGVGPASYTIARSFLALASAPPPAVPDAVGVQTKVKLLADRYCEGWCESGGCGKFADCMGCEIVTLFSTEPTPSPDPAWIAKCATCDRIVDTREKAEGGDPHGCEVKDGQWACSVGCYEVQIGDAPSPEPQASNAGAVEALRPFAQAAQVYRDAMSAPLSGSISSSADLRAGEGMRYETALEAVYEHFVSIGLEPIFAAEAALSTPGPQTGERDGEVVAWAKEAALVRLAAMVPGADSFQLSNAHFSGFNVPLVRQSALIADREALEAAERRLAEVEERASMELAVSEAEKMMRHFAESRAEAAEHCLAEADERERKDTSRLNWLEANPRAIVSKVGGWDSEDEYRWAVQVESGNRNDREWDEVGCGQTARAALDAALRAKPEAQAIVGKEADHG